METELQIILLIRSYNRPEYLQKTLSSVLLSDIDICVKRYIFDDCSNDDNTIQLLSNRIRDRKSISILSRYFLFRVLSFCNLSLEKKYPVYSGGTKTDAEQKSNIHSDCNTARG